MTLPSATSRVASSIQSLFDALSTMDQFDSKDHFPCDVVDDSETGGLAPWVELDSQWLHLWFFHCILEDECEGKATQHSSPLLLEQETRIAGMHWVQRLPFGIDNKHF